MKPTSHDFEVADDVLDLALGRTPTRHECRPLAQTIADARADGRRAMRERAVALCTAEAIDRDTLAEGEDAERTIALTSEAHSARVLGAKIGRLDLVEER